MSDKDLLIDIYKYAVKMSLPKVFMPKSCILEGDVLSINGVSYNLLDYDNIYVFGSGKASVPMAVEMENILADRIKSGLVVTNQDAADLKYIEVCRSSHPILSEQSIDCGKKLIAKMSQCKKNDLYIYLLSGGSSALIELPKSNLTLKDLQRCNKLMLEHSLKIQDINTVRKHLSQIKGGKLAKVTKAKSVALVLSDVVGDDLSSIGSAPLFEDNSTCKDALEILKQAGIYNLVSPNIIDVLKSCDEQKNKDINVPHHILASNKQALQAAAHRAKSNNLDPVIIANPMTGDVADMHLEMLKYFADGDGDCLIFGGECTVAVKKPGKGGRNQHLALLMLREICASGMDIAFLSAGTDGIDGNSDAVGGVVDLSDCGKISSKEINDYLDNYNSYEALKHTGGLIITGDSGTNVVDIAILLRSR